MALRGVLGGTGDSQGIQSQRSKCCVTHDLACHVVEHIPEPLQECLQRHHTLAETCYLHGIFMHQFIPQTILQ